MLIFFDDILVYSSTIDEHKTHLREVLRLLREQPLYAKRSKCKFGCVTVDYLEHIISENGIAVDPRKLQVIKEWPLPKIAKTLRGFLGLIGYYRKFVRAYGNIAASLNRMLRKDGFHWTKES